MAEFAPRQKHEKTAQEHSSRPEAQRSTNRTTVPNNLVLQSLYAAGVVRAKLVVGGANDPEEAEADRMADAAMQARPVGCSCGPGEPPCPKCHAASQGAIRRKGGTGSHLTSAGNELHARMASSRSEPLHSAVRQRVEPVLGTNLEAVRVHGDNSSHAAARQLGARAFTLGQDIYLGAGEQAHDVSLLAHEAAHVVQQSDADGASRVIRRDPVPNQTKPLEERRQAFEDSVLSAAKQRLFQNQINLGMWRHLIESELTAREVQRQASATTTVDLAITAMQHRALSAFDAWAGQRNPYMRDVLEHNMRGEWQACTGCHMAVRASAMAAQEPHIGPAWRAPWETLSVMASEQSGRLTDEARNRLIQSFIQPSTCPALPGAPPLQQQKSAPAAMIQRDVTPATPPPAKTDSGKSEGNGPPPYPFSPSAQMALAQAQRLQSILAPLGSHGYRVIPDETMSLLANASPTQLRDAILEKIGFRIGQYSLLISRIENGDVSYLDLAPILDEMLPSAEADVRAEVESAKARRALLRTLEGILTMVLTLLTPLFPPLLFVTAPLMFHQGWTSYQTGYNFMLGQGANNVFSPEQQDQAGALMAGGIANMAMATVAMATGARPTLDWTATRVAVISDVNIARQLVARAQLGPIPAEEVQTLMQPGLAGRAAHGYLDMRGMQILYRGQGAPSSQILSPLARTQGLPASLSMEDALQAAGLNRLQIAGYTARWNDQPVPAFDAPSGMQGQPLGGAGIPTTRNVAVASNFARSSAGGQPTIYVLRVPKGAATNVAAEGWGRPGPSQSLAESEWVVMHEINGKYVIKTLPADVVGPLVADAPPGAGWSLVSPP